MTDKTIQKVAKFIAEADSVTVSTGAGVSKESGIPTFRDALDGLWSNYDPQKLATPTAFLNNPKLVWDWYAHRREMIGACEPNPGHYALAEMEAMLFDFALITQNIDGLHEQAGNEKVFYLHGNIQEHKCFANCQGIPTLVDLSEVTSWDQENEPPLCPHCDKAFLRPNVVWFGEGLPMDQIRGAEAASAKAKVMLVVGTSGTVYPANQLPSVARQNGAIVVEINPYETEISHIMDFVIREPSGEALPKLLEAIKAIRSEE